MKAPDLPSHGASPRSEVPLTPRVAAEWIASELADRPLDLVVGHGFGAAVGLELARRSTLVERLVLDGFPDPATDRAAEADALVEAAALARRDIDLSVLRIATEHPNWHREDCRHAARDLASLQVAEVADGIRSADGWPDRSTGDRERNVSVIDRQPDHVLHREQPDAWLSLVLEYASE